MIGIDVVDLSFAALESNPFRKGYLNKIFSTAEQTLIFNHADPLVMVWLLWSMKEAVYKVFSREFNLRIFAPIDIHCCIVTLAADQAEGKVTAYNRGYYTNTTICSDYLFSVAAKQKSSLQDVEVITNPYPATFDYHATAPESVSHHGAYLLLAY